MRTHLRSLLKWVITSHFAFSIACAGLLSLAPPFGDGAVFQHGRPLPVFGGATPGAEVTIEFQDQRIVAVADAEGHWQGELRALRPTFDPAVLKVIAEGETRTVTDILIGEVWLASGQSNMARTAERVPSALTHLKNHPDRHLRFLQVKASAKREPQSSVQTSGWRPATEEHATAISATSLHFAHRLRQMLGVPVGVVVSAWGGVRVAPWTPLTKLQEDPRLRVWLTEFEEAKQRQPALLPDYQKQLETWRQTPGDRRGNQPGPPLGDDHKGAPANAYNGMIHPLVPFAIRGVIWYQGESDAIESFADRYALTLEAMLNGWREAWRQPELPFLQVQVSGWLAEVPELSHLGPHRVSVPLSDPNGASQWGRLRLEQAAFAQRMPRTCTVVTIDLYDPFDIHPLNKDVVGWRLAGLALAQVYGYPTNAASPQAVGPAHRWPDGRVEVRVKQGEGLELTNNSVQVSTAGTEGNFQAAACYVENGHLVVVPPRGQIAVRVRYAWGETPLSSVRNGAGLPLEPFDLDVGKKE